MIDSEKMKSAIVDSEPFTELCRRIYYDVKDTEKYHAEEINLNLLVKKVDSDEGTVVEISTGAGTFLVNVEDYLPEL